MTALTSGIGPSGNGGVLRVSSDCATRLPVNLPAIDRSVSQFEPHRERAKRGSGAASEQRSGAAGFPLAWPSDRVPLYPPRRFSLAGPIFFYLSFLHHSARFLWRGRTAFLYLESSWSGFPGFQVGSCRFAHDPPNPPLPGGRRQHRASKLCGVGSRVIASPRPALAAGISNQSATGGFCVGRGSMPMARLLGGLTFALGAVLKVAGSPGAAAFSLHARRQRGGTIPNLSVLRQAP